MSVVKTEHFLFRRILDKFNLSLKHCQLFPAGSRILLAVSGGPDSIAMLHLFRMIQKKLNLTLGVAHVNHGLRKTSHKDELFVKQNATQFQLPFYSISQLDLVKNRSKDSIETAARNFRYQFFKNLCHENQYEYLVTGHNRDDQAETILMRLINGTGLSGLAGIRVLTSQENLTIVRPLLHTGRDEIRGALRQAKIRSRMDATNNQNIFLRNRIRNHLIPHIQAKFNSAFVEHLVALAEESMVTFDALHASTQQLFKQHASVTKNSVEFQNSFLCSQFTIIRAELFRRSYIALTGSIKGLTRRHVQAIENLLFSEGKKTIQIGSSTHIVNRSKKLIFMRKH